MLGHYGHTINKVYVTSSLWDFHWVEQKAETQAPTDIINEESGH